MILSIFYILNFIVFIITVSSFRLETNDRRISLSLVQSLIFLPLLSGEYFYISFHLEPDAARLILLSENLFSLIWAILAYWLYCAVSINYNEPRWFSIIYIGVCAVVMGISVISAIFEDFSYESSYLSFSKYGAMYFCGIFLMLSMLAAAWRIEFFWRNMPSLKRWEYKYLVIGVYLICGSMFWTSSYRLTYHRIYDQHFLLLSLLVLSGWILMLYAVARHRLLNRKIYVSRKVIYASVVPFVCGIYLTGFGVIILLMQYLKKPLPFVVRWLIFALGLAALASMAISGKVRHSIKFFISTHFYINKYEYRDEWLLFSNLLKGAITEAEIVTALHQVLSESLYTNVIYIWVGNDRQGYRSAFPKDLSAEKLKFCFLSPSDPLILYLKTHHHYYISEKTNVDKTAFFTELNLVLMTPLSISEQLVGLIGLGPEFTGGQYGHDDFDLLSALGSQAASALLVARMAEELSRARQQEAWDIMSAFILHDIKNAASMLSLIRQNAPDHIHDPEFQQDMLDTIDDSLKRMAKVQNRLNALKGDIKPVFQDVDFCRELSEACRKLSKRLIGLHVTIHCDEPIRIKTDMNLFLHVIENLFLNALEAGASEMAVEITQHDGNQLAIELIDNGSGLPNDLLPEALFEPFKTTKYNGSGIGLWQVKKILISLGGVISAENTSSGGARFVIYLPTEAHKLIRQGI